jgi:ankyrin repeat protein
MDITETQLAQIKAFDGFIDSFLNEQKLYTAIKKGSAEGVREILLTNPTLPLKAIVSQYPLNYACGYDNLEIVEILLDNKFPINGIDEDGDTPLHCAVMHRNLELVKLLVRRGALIDAKNDRGETPIIIALMDNEIDLFNFLMESGAEICLRSKLLMNKETFNEK